MDENDDAAEEIDKAWQMVRELQTGSNKPLQLSEKVFSFPWMDNIITIRADFQQGMESMSSFKINTVTENYWLIYAAATVIMTLSVGYCFQSLS